MKGISALIRKTAISIGAAVTLGVVLLAAPQTAFARGCGPSGADLQQGPRGGCYYINRNGNKTYVERDCCR